MKPYLNDVCILKCRNTIEHELFEIGQKCGFINSHKYPFLPRFSVSDTDVYIRLIHEIEEYGKINTRINVSKSILAWCVYAGIGTVHHWKVDGDSFDKKCIFETLTEERGVFAMDEYVQDCIGHPHDSTEGKRLTAHIMSTAKIIFFIMIAQNPCNFLRSLLPCLLM